MKWMGAFNGDLVRGYEEKSLSSFLGNIGVGVNVLATLKGTPGLQVLSYSITANDLLGELMIAKEKGKYKDFKNKVYETILNQALSEIVGRKYGKGAQAIYEGFIAPKVDKAIQNKDK